MGRRIDPSWGGPIELFLVPASAPRLGATSCSYWKAMKFGCIAFLMCGRIEIDPRLRMFVLFYLICVVAGTGPRTLDLSSHYDQYLSHCSTAGHAKRRQMAICFRPAATHAKNGDDRRFLWTDPEGAIISVDVVPRHLPFALINTNLSPAKRPNGQNLTNI